MGSEEITLILNCNHLFIKGYYQGKVIHCSSLISVFPQGAVLMFLYSKGQKLLSYSLFSLAVNASAHACLEWPA